MRTHPGQPHAAGLDLRADGRNYGSQAAAREGSHVVIERTLAGSGVQTLNVEVFVWSV